MTATETISIRLVGLSGVTGVETGAGGAVFSARVGPNPLGPGSTMRLVTTRPGPVAVQIFDASGRLVRDVVPRRSLAPGMYQFSIPAVDGSGRRLGNGIFFYRVESNEGVPVGRLAVLK